MITKTENDDLRLTKKEDFEKDISEGILIGSNIRRLRKSRMIKLNDLAEQLKLSQTTLSRKERGERPFTKEELSSLSDFFEIDTSRFYEALTPVASPLYEDDIREGFQMAHRIKSLRLEAGETQEYLDKILSATGLTYKIEKGKQKISFWLLITIAEHFNVSTSYLCGQTRCRDVYKKNKNIGQDTAILRITDLRKSEHMSIEKLEKKLELKRHALNAIEKGQRDIEAVLLYKIAEFFNVSVAYMCGETESPSLADEALVEKTAVAAIEMILHNIGNDSVCRNIIKQISSHIK